MRRDGRRKRVILIAQGLPDCGGKPNVSVARGIRVTRRGAGDDTSTNPIINSISCGGDLVHDFLPPLAGDIIDHTPLTNKARFRFNFLYRELCPREITPAASS